MTLKDLKIRHETGERLNKTAKAQIREQLKRVCGKHGCRESLAFKHKSVLYCTPSHSKKKPHKKPTKAQNKAKKDKFYAEHGITFNKNIKRSMKTKVGLNVDGFNLIYENYKDPLKPVPPTVGFGYYGTVAQTDDGAYIQCHYCGKLFKHLGAHLVSHRTNTHDYKEKFGLMKSTALVSEDVRVELEKRSIERGMGYKTLPEHLKEYNEKVRNGIVKHAPNYDRNTWSLERRNKEGNCPDQVLEKIKEAALQLGHTPSLEEFLKFYHHRYISAIVYQHGSYLKAVKKAKLISAKEVKEPDNEKLIKALIDFKKREGRIPMTSDFNRGTLLYPRGMYNRRFGSLNNARVEAGMDAILPLPFGQKIILSPDEYRKYREGHGLSTDAIKARKRREKIKDGRNNI